MLTNPSEDVLDPPLTDTHPKGARGFNHPRTAVLLCPADLREEYKDKPE